MDPAGDFIHDFDRSVLDNVIVAVVVAVQVMDDRDDDTYATASWPYLPSSRTPSWSGRRRRRGARRGGIAPARHRTTPGTDCSCRTF